MPDVVLDLIQQGKEWLWCVVEPLWTAEVVCPSGLSSHGSDSSGSGWFSPGLVNTSALRMSVRSTSSCAMVAIWSCTSLVFTIKDSLVLSISPVKEHSLFMPSPFHSLATFFPLLPSDDLADFPSSKCFCCFQGKQNPSFIGSGILWQGRHAQVWVLCSVLSWCLSSLVVALSCLALGFLP